MIKIRLSGTRDELAEALPRQRFERWAVIASARNFQNSIFVLQLSKAANDEIDALVSL